MPSPYRDDDGQRRICWSILDVDSRGAGGWLPRFAQTCASSCHQTPIGFSLACSGIPALTRSVMRLLRRRILLRMARPPRQAPEPEPAQLRDDLLGFSSLPCPNSPSAAKALLQGGSLGVIAGRSSCIEIGSSQTDRVENQSSLRNRRENAMSNHAALDVSQGDRDLCLRRS
jgi:hypothetical protein